MLKEMFPVRAVLVKPGRSLIRVIVSATQREVEHKGVVFHHTHFPKNRACV